MNKEEIYRHTKDIAESLKKRIKNMGAYVSVQEYRDFVRYENGCEIWTDAFCKALLENENIFIPAKEEPYYIDRTVIIPKNRHIEADSNAVIRLMAGVKTLMFRNEHTKNGSDFPIDTSDRDCNISINGGCWEESVTVRLGYGQSGMYDEERSFYGVSTCMLFNNAENISLTNMKFSHTGGFAVQLGNVKNGHFENIFMDVCFADGLHINGNCENLFIKNIRGWVGDDLVALNAYDWKNSSVNFGPIKNVYCEGLYLSDDSKYKAIRVQPGIYYYKDGSFVDCALENIVIKKARGINTYKMYFQTPAYIIGEEAEKGGPGSGRNIFFEDIEGTIDTPVDKFAPYLEADEITGAFSLFEINANIENIHFENIRVNMDKEKFPMSFIVSIGPKSVRKDGKEIFDPHHSCIVNRLTLKDVFVNGEKITCCNGYIHKNVFKNLYEEVKSDAEGIVEEIILL